MWLELYDLCVFVSSDVFEFHFEKTQTASFPIGGSYTLTYNGHTTGTLEYGATEEEVSIQLYKSIDSTKRSP